MKRNKGFTLVELLAVIVILAVIALIATPTVLSMIEKSRKGAAESSMLSYVDTIEKTLLIDSMSSVSTDYDGTYTVKGKKMWTDSEDNATTLEIKGDEPTEEGTVTVSQNTVTYARLTFGKYTVIYEMNNTTKKSTYCSEANAKDTFEHCNS